MRWLPFVADNFRIHSHINGIYVTRSIVQREGTRVNTQCQQSVYPNVSWSARQMNKLAVMEYHKRCWSCSLSITTVKYETIAAGKFNVLIKVKSC